MDAPRLNILVVDDETNTRSALKEGLRREVRAHVHEQKVRFGVHNLVGRSKSMREIVGLVRKVSASQATTVLLRGESGTGKDVIARAIHDESARADKPFMNITCTALQ